MTARPSGGPMLAPLLALVLAVLSTAMAAGAEQPATIPTIGWLVFEAGESGLDGFRRGLRELGYVEGQNIAIEARFPAGSGDHLAEQIEELARLKVKIIVTGGVPATLAAKRAALPIPVVFIMADPVGSGVVASLAHPGGTMTGQSLAIENNSPGNGCSCSKRPRASFPGSPFSGTQPTTAALRRGERCRGWRPPSG